jgi:CheY-like chemotaxis protein
VKVRQTTISGKTAGAAVRSGSRKAAALAPEPSGVTLEMLLAEVQAVRDTQQLILDALGGLRRGQAQAAPSVGAGTDDAIGFGETGDTTLSPIRTAARKSVVLVDDDADTRQAAMSELERADIPVRAFSDGNRALSAIAEDKPDVIILELAVGGDLGGKDLVNMIKATMEWVDIPVVLWTREPISNQKEARQIHGADEVVTKSLGAAALVARVITVFRR